MTAPFTSAIVHLARLAEPTTQPSGTSGQGPEWGEAAPVGLLILLLMGGALFLLIKSMNRNLRRVPASFDPADATDAADSADGADTADPAEPANGADAADAADPADAADVIVPGGTPADGPPDAATHGPPGAATHGAESDQDPEDRPRTVITPRPHPAGADPTATIQRPGSPGS